jgi:hypothetical protein
VATDSEWDKRLGADAWLSTAFKNLVATVVFMRQVDERTEAALRREARALGVLLFFLERHEDDNLLERALPHLYPDGPPKRLTLVNFFSPKDFEYAFGWAAWREALVTGKVRQHSCLTGRVGKVLLRDLKGWAPRDAKKLVAFARALGVETPQKSAMDEYKTEMARGLMERPADFLRYAVADARVLLEIYAVFVAFIRDVLREALDIDLDDVWDDGRLPPTQGRLVHDVFEHWVYRQAGASEALLRFCARKQGYLDHDAAGAALHREMRAWVLGRCRSPGDLARLAAPDDPEERAALNDYGRAPYLHTVLGAASVSCWASLATTESACFNALVQGGRCNNEDPYRYRAGAGLDVDISGCYGSSLRSLVYPVGLPSAWSYKPNDRRPTLGAWLKQHERDLVPGLWTCTFTGKLPFEQDLLYSKLVKAGAIRRAADSRDGDDIDATLALLRNELINAVVTSDILEAVRRVATPDEWRSVSKLEVVTAAAYLARDRTEGVDDWCRAVLADPVQGLCPRLSRGITQDRRTRAWFGVPLEGFIGRLVDTRTAYKARAKAARGTPEEDELRGKSEVLKLFINVLYGDYATRFFGVGNTVLANVITARARRGIWQVAKALGLLHSVTDGGPYAPSAVRYFKGKKPGLATLSRTWAWKDSKHGRTTRPLRGLEGWDFGQPLPEDADRAALEHVRRFWAPYKLEFQFTLEHKPENSFAAAAWWNKGDCLMQTATGLVYKARGKNQSKRDDARPHPLLGLLENIVAGLDDFPLRMFYQTGGILKIGKWLLAQNSKGGFADIKRLRPGDDVPRRTLQARFNNTHFPVKDAADYARRRNRKKTRGVRPVLWFEKYRRQGITAVHRRMADDDLQP